MAEKLDKTGANEVLDRARKTSEKQRSGSDQGRFTVRGEAYHALKQIAESTDRPIDEVLLRAIALYIQSFEAHQEGKAVGTTTRVDALDTEFIGF